MLYNNFASKDQSGNPTSGDDVITLLRAVVYLGYKFDDHFLLNTEIEYENAVVASDKGGEAEVEFAYIDYMHSAAFNARSGLVLIPSGLVNQLHEPTAFLGARRPDVEDLIIPSTWRELGAGAYGTLGPDFLSGVRRQRPERRRIQRGRGHPRRPPGGLRGPGEELGLRRPGRLHGRPGPARGRVGFSGDAGQGQYTPSGVKISALTTVFDAHVDWRWRGLWLRGLYAHTTVEPGGADQPAQQLRGRRVRGQPPGGLVPAGRVRRPVALRHRRE